MEPSRFGKTLGIGVRVASRMARERARAAGDGQKPKENAAPAAQARRSGVREATPAARIVAGPARRLGEGTRGFFRASLGTLAHTGATLWLEVTGLFFALFALFFFQNAWRVRYAFRSGAEHGHFVLYTLLGVSFCYFSVTSFLRSRKRSRKARQA